MNPRFLHSETMVSMSMGFSPWLPLLQPVFAGDTNGTNLDANWVAAQLGDQGELIHLGGGPNVLIISQGAQAGAPRARLQGAVQAPAVMAEAVPGQPGAVVETHRPRLAEEFDQCTRQESVVQCDLAGLARTDNMDRTRIASQLFADGTKVDEAGHH